MNLQRAIEYVDRKSIQYVDDGLTPGAGITIVSKDQVHLTKGYGISDIITNEKYTTDTTQILIASVSKVISGTLLCLLEKENPGKILNAKTNIVTSVPYVSENMIVKDLVSHRSGIPEQFGSISETLGNTRNFIINSLANAPNRNFRNEHQYTNLPFTQGIEIGVSIANLTLEEAYDKIFNLIGMHNTSTTFAPDKYKGYGDLGSANNLNNTKRWYPIFNTYVEQQLSAGGIYTTISDMATFIQFHLRQAALAQDDRLISDDFYKGVTVRNVDSMYGIGVNISYQKVGNDLHKMFNHNGGLVSTRTILVWTPSLDIGIFVHSNSSPNGFPEAIAQAFYLILGGGTNEEADTLFSNMDQTFTKLIGDQLCPIVSNIAGSQSIDSSLVGSYYNNEWGDITIDSHGMIKFKYLDATPLFTDDIGTNKNKYRFVLKDLSDVSYAGEIIVNGDKLVITYQCEEKIFDKLNNL